MRTLVIDTATRACSVALFDDESLIAGEYHVIGRGHAERLVPLIASLPDYGKAQQIMVNIGPGSFTGIRVGIAAARALGLAWGVPCHGYACLSLVAAMADVDCAVDVVMNGGHGEYFFQSFDAAGNILSDIASLPPSQAAALSTADMIAGDVSEELVALRGNGTGKILLPDARQWHRIAHQTPLSPSALYGRGADAKPMAVL